METRDIEDYGIIGNGLTAALVGINGSIDYCCMPHFDSSPLFTRLISSPTGKEDKSHVSSSGTFSIHPLRKEDTTNKQHYFPDSNVLVTKFLLSEGVGQVVDFMPQLCDEEIVYTSTGGGVTGTNEASAASSSALDGAIKGGCCHLTKLFRSKVEHLEEDALNDEVLLSRIDKMWYDNCIVRRLEIVHGRIDFELECSPVFEYGRKSYSVVISEDRKCALFSTDSQQILLQSNIPCLEKGESGGVIGQFVLAETDPEKSCVFVLKFFEQPCIDPNQMEFNQINHIVEKTNQLAVGTINFWQQFIKKSNYQGIFREMVNRSLLSLKMLMYKKTGAIISSPTTSLPKVIGGSRNYDYRYMWIRDATFAMNAFLQTGMIDEAAKIVHFFGSVLENHKQVADVTVPKLPIYNIYTIEGEKLSHPLEEIPEFNGFRNSKPVRVGNTASDSIEFDIYGELLDAIYLYDSHRPISYELWLKLKTIVEFVIINWNRPDTSIWETKGAEAHFVYSKVMSWCCIDRALRLAERRSFPANTKKLLKVRNEIYEDVMLNGYNETLNTFIQHYGSQSMDVSLVIMPLVGFLPISDPRIINTINAINRKPREGGLVSSSLVYRHQRTALGSHEGTSEGTYNMLTFWLIRVLSLMSEYDKSKLRQAQLMFEQISTYSNHVDLYSEVTSFSGYMLGNFIHANTHSSLIMAAVELAKHLK